MAALKVVFRPLPQTTPYLLGQRFAGRSHQCAAYSLDYETDSLVAVV